MSIRVMNWAWDLQCVKGASKLILMALADSANNEGECWPRLETLAQKASTSRPTVKRAIKDLEQLGLVIVEPRKREDGTQMANMYRLTMINPEIQEELLENKDIASGVQNDPLGGQNEPLGVHPRTGEGFTCDPGRGSPVTPLYKPKDNPKNNHNPKPLSCDTAKRSRRSRKAKGSEVVSVERQQVFVEKGSPQWKAWCSFRGKSPPAIPSRETGKDGWYFNSEWPPHHPNHVASTPPPTHEA